MSLPVRHRLYALLLGVSLFGSAQGEERWYRILVNGQNAGDVHEVTEERDALFVTRLSERLVIDREGHRITLGIDAEESETGAGLQRGEYTVRMEGDETRLTASVSLGQINLTTVTSAGRYEQVMPITDPPLGPEGVRRATLDHLKSRGDSLRYEMLTPDSSSLIRATRTRLTDHDPSGAFTVQEERDDGTTELLTLDAQAVVLKSREDSPLGVVELERVAAAPDAPTGVRVPLAGRLELAGPLPGTGRSVRAMTLDLDGGENRLTATAFNGPGQRATPLSPQRLRLHTALPGHDPASAIRPVAQEQGPNALFPSDAAEVRDFALAIAARSDSEESRLANTVGAVHARLAFDPGFVVANGLDVLRRGRGTCVAYATLTATTLRALGYPSRVVYGYVYAEGAFIGHAWTEVWSEGRWRGLDAALYDDGSFDAARIGLARAHGAEGPASGLEALGRTLGKFRVRRVTEVLQ